MTKRDTTTVVRDAMADVIVAEVEEKLELLQPVESATVELVFDPPWGPERMSEAAKLESGLP